MDRDRTAALGTRPGRAREIAAGGGALILLAVAVMLLRDGRPADPVESAEVAGLLARLDGMALVYEETSAGRPYFIDRYEVTNEEFGRFVRASGYVPAQSAGFLRHFLDPGKGVWPAELARHPVVFVSLEDAETYARHVGKEIPTAEEWSRAAREAQKFGRYFLNAWETGIRATTRVGTFESGSTGNATFIDPPVYDLLGNVWEWTASAATTWRGTRAVKGGSFNDSYLDVRAAGEQPQEPGSRHFALGFRCVLRDAYGLVRRLVESAATSGPATRQAVQQALRRFGDPMVRLLQRIRFDAAVLYRLQAGGGLDDFVLPLADGRVVVAGAEGEIQVFSGADGERLATRGGFPRIRHAAAADLDGDGDEEIYLVTDVDTAPTPLDRVTVPEFLAVRGPDGLTHLVDPGSGRRIPWVAGAAGLPQSLWEALDVNRRDVFPRPDPGKTSPEGWFRWDRPGIPAVSRPLASDPARFGWVSGFVPRSRQAVERLDLDDGEVRTAWRRVTPGTQFLPPLPVPGRGELILQAVYLRRGGFPESEDSFHTVLDLGVLDAATGDVVAAGLVPGGSASLVPLDGAANLLHLWTTTGHELLLRRQGGGFRVREFPAGDGEFPLAEVDRGPPPYAASCLRLSYALLPGAADRPRYAVRAARVDLLDGSPIPVQSRSLEEVPEVGEVGPRRFVLQGSRSHLLQLADRTLLCLDGELATRWRRGDLERLDLDRVDPIDADLGLGGSGVVIVPWRLFGFLALGGASGRTEGSWLNPGAVLLDLARVAQPGRPDVLLASYRDSGVVGFRPARTPLARELERLLAVLDPPAGLP